jgi:uncharacterized protein
MAKKALMVAGGLEFHEPKQCVDVFAPFLRAQGFEVIISETLESFRDSALMQSLSLVVPCWTCGEISGDQINGLLGAVQSGVGLVGWHGGMGDAFRNCTQFQFMVGGQFVDHPGNIIPYKIHISDWDDPITDGIADFTMVSEQYYMHVDPGNKVLATSTFTDEYVPWVNGTVMPVVWKRPYGKGRVFYASYGHVAKDFDVPEAKTLLQRGLMWAAR